VAGVAESGAGADRGRTGPDLIREHLRVLAGAAFAGLVVGLAGGVIGRIAMRLLVLTSDDGVDGAITDDDAVVNQFTLSGTVGLVLFIALGGVALAWLYVGAHRSLPASPRARSAIWAVLLWSVMGSQVFDPDGFDFSQLSPLWLGVVLFSILFLAMGAAIPIGVDRAIERWPSTWPGYLPFVAVVPGAVLAVGGGLAAALGDEASRRWAAVRWFGAAVMAAIVVLVGLPTLADVVRILT
jgi:hypothetical protein